MKPFLLELLPWALSILSMTLCLLAYLMYLRQKEMSAKLLKHWDDSIALNQLACHHIRKIEDDLRAALRAEADQGEGWKKQ